MKLENYPENIEEIRKFAEEMGIDVKYLLGERYESDLGWNLVRSLPENIKFNVAGGLSLCRVKSLPANIEFNVGDYLNLFSVKSLSESVVFNVGGFSVMSNIKHIPSGTIFNVGESLDMRFSTSVSKDVVFNVGKWLWLYSVENISSDVKFNVGGEVAIRKIPYSGLSNCVIFDDPPTEDNPYDPLKNYSPKPKVKIGWC